MTEKLAPLMRDIPLNDFAKDILNDSLWFVQDENYKTVQMAQEKRFTPELADWYTSHEYFEKIKAMGPAHAGFPEVNALYSYTLGHLRFSKEENHQAKIPHVTEKQNGFFEKIQRTFNLKRSALFAIYHPGCYISWHNNANASAYNFVFTWSDTGDGYWEHYDNRTKEFVKIPDKPGWQCKAGYFGAYEDGEDKLVYHTARTYSSLRMTVAFILDRSEMSQGIQDWIIDDIHA